MFTKYIPLLYIRRQHFAEISKKDWQFDRSSRLLTVLKETNKVLTFTKASTTHTHTSESLSSLRIFSLSFFLEDKLGFWRLEKTWNTTNFTIINLVLIKYRQFFYEKFLLWMKFVVLTEIFESIRKKTFIFHFEKECNCKF